MSEASIVTSRSPRKRLRIGLLSASASRSGGGVFEALITHSKMLAEAGYEPVVIARTDRFAEIDRERFGDAEVVLVPRGKVELGGYAPKMLSTLMAANLDLLHLHGIWMYPSAAASMWSSRTGRPYVISPHGMLDPWILSRGVLKKRLAKFAYEQRSWRQATCFHALTSHEANDIASCAGRSDTIIIPNSIESNFLPSRSEVFVRRPTIVYLGRIHPKKNIENLISAWRSERPALAQTGAHLKIAGWGDPEHVDALKKLLLEDNIDDIQFLGPVYGEEKLELVNSARYLVLPSFSEGLPMVVLEAWSAGTPAIMSKHCHLPEGFASGAAIECGTTPESIRKALREALMQPEASWKSMSESATTLSNTVFSSAEFRRRWLEFYESLCS